MTEASIATVLEERSRSASVGAFTLRVVEGPDLGAEVVVDDTLASRLLIGRSPACALRLADGRCSRRHAAVELVDGALRLHDLGSTNGTFIDRVRVVEVVLQGGEVVSLGGTRIAVEHRNAAAAAHVPEAMGFGRLVGHSLEMRRLYPLCEKLAQSKVTVLIEGETGTGKEVLAESIHERGPRRDRPFVVFDCTTVPSNLMEAELFGYERGAFTGAQQSRAGVFEQADGGTLLIDEIGDLDLPLQAKFLRALDKLEVRRLGGSRVVKVDVRLIAATRRDLDQEVQAGRFRDDLFHRLAIGRIELPPLRRRKGELPLLVAELARQLGGSAAMFPASLMASWTSYDWPGNVRELRNAVARFIELGEEHDLAQSRRPEEAAAVEDAVSRVLALELPLHAARQRVVDEFERRYLLTVLERCGNNVTKAARASGVARRHFHRLLSRVRDGEDPPR